MGLRGKFSAAVGLMNPAADNPAIRPTGDLIISKARKFHNLTNCQAGSSGTHSRGSHTWDDDHQSAKSMS
jgi:hypothetical protein